MRASCRLLELAGLAGLAELLADRTLSGRVAGRKAEVEVAEVLQTGVSLQKAVRMAAAAAAAALVDRKDWGLAEKVDQML